jgi:hypothetical protein
MLSVSTLRQGSARSLAADRAIVDLLELQELDMAPGIVTTAQLSELWGCDQSQVSRRLAAIDRLGPWRVQPNRGREGGYWLAPRLKPAPPLPAVRPPGSELTQARRRRWEALQGQWGSRGPTEEAAQA